MVRLQVKLKHVHASIKAVHVFVKHALNILKLFDVGYIRPDLNEWCHQISPNKRNPSTPHPSYSVATPDLWRPLSVGCVRLGMCTGEALSTVTAVTVPELRRQAKAMANKFYILLVFSAYRPHLIALNIVSDHVWHSDFGGAIGIDQQTFILNISVSEKCCERR